MNVETLERDRYFVTLIDDAIRKVWIYFLKSKDQVFLWTLTRSIGPARLAFKMKRKNEKVEFSNFEKPAPDEERCCMESPFTFYFYF